MRAKKNMEKQNFEDKKQIQILEDFCQNNRIKYMKQKRVEF